MGWASARKGCLALAACLGLTCALTGGAGHAAPIPPGDAHCIREMSEAIAEFSTAALDEVLAARIASGEAEEIEPDPALEEALREAIITSCPSIPAISDSGICGDADSLAEWAECVVDSQKATLLALVDALLGGPTPTPTPTVTPSPGPTVTVTPTRTPHCAGRFEACFGPGVSGCCKGFECRYTGLSSVPFCLPEPPSASGAFVDGEGARFY